MKIGELNPPLRNTKNFDLDNIDSHPHNSVIFMRKMYDNDQLLQNPH